MRTKIKKEMLNGIEGITYSKLIARNTIAYTLATGEENVIFHNTVIVSKKGNEFTLNSGGFRTMSTKERINQYSPVRIDQNNHLWYIGGYLFYDGITVDYAGNILGQKIVPEIAESENKIMLKKINNYCSLITKENLPVPSNGDCWDCATKTKEGITMGDTFKNHSHLISHMEEKYVVGSLLVNAMKEAGYIDHQIGSHYQFQYHDTFRRAVRKYLQKRLLTK